MVLYHWLNYFYGSHDNRYLRFLTPSFIFITGFLISNVYLSKYGITDQRLPQRLVHRGLKILAIFILLNVFIIFLVVGPSNGEAWLAELSPSNLLAVFVTGNVVLTGIGKGIAFYILVPISYLLLLSAGLLVVAKYCKYAFHTVCACFLLSILILHLRDVESPNLELLTIGLLGVLVGHLPIAKINAFVRHPYSLVTAYLGYVVAITIWNVVYPLQIIGVGLSLMILYLLGARGHEKSKVRSRITLLGRYSLFGYIAQIAILQVLRQGFRHVDLGPAALEISFVGAFALTLLSVEAVDRVRAGSTAADRFYKLVFA
jgi:hypothetical protein